MGRHARSLAAACLLLGGCMTAFNQAAPVAASAAPASAGTCAYDRVKMFGLSQQAFDQNLEGGWRELSYRPGCTLAAADLIRDYRESKGLTANMLYWHEGQLRASAGQRKQAVALFAKSRRERDDAFGWNYYVDATIAFLNQDRSSLLAARQGLARLPRPAGFQPPNLPADINMKFTWPPNLAAVDAMFRCFGRSYKEAYPVCRK